jgi:hypothetical protein
MTEQNEQVERNLKAYQVLVCLFFSISRGVSLRGNQQECMDQHHASKEITKTQAFQNTNDFFSRMVARARLLCSLKGRPGRKPGLAFLGKCRKGVEPWVPFLEFSSPSGSS